MIQILLWLPLAAGVVCFVVPRRAVPAVALLGTLGTLALSIALVIGFNSDTVGLQHTVNESWIPALGVRYQLGVDGISIRSKKRTNSSRSWERNAPRAAVSASPTRK